MKNLSLAVAIAVAATTLAFGDRAHASDGTIQFLGSISASTCKINGGGSASSFQVALPPVSTTSLADVGSTAGRTGFNIELTECNPTSGRVSTFFEAGESVNPQNGNLIIAGNGAENVELSLLNDKQEKIFAGAEAAAQNSQSVEIGPGVTILNYFVEYQSLGDATAGEANSHVQYTMSYE